MLRPQIIWTLRCRMVPGSLLVLTVLRGNAVFDALRRQLGRRASRTASPRRAWERVRSRSRRSLISYVFALLLGMALGGCARPEGDRLVIATPWAASERAAIEAAYRDAVPLRVRLPGWLSFRWMIQRGSCRVLGLIWFSVFPRPISNVSQWRGCLR